VSTGDALNGAGGIGGVEGWGWGRVWEVMVLDVMRAPVSQRVMQNVGLKTGCAYRSRV